MHVLQIRHLALGIMLLLIGVGLVGLAVFRPGDREWWLRWGRGRDVGARLSVRSMVLWGLLFTAFGTDAVLEALAVHALRYAWPAVLLLFLLLFWSGWKDNRSK